MKEGDWMKKLVYPFCAGVGGYWVGCYVDKLDTVIGCVFFMLGLVLLLSSIVFGFKWDKQNKESRK